MTDPNSQDALLDLPPDQRRKVAEAYGKLLRREKLSRNEETAIKRFEKTREERLHVASFRRTSCRRRKALALVVGKLLEDILWVRDGVVWGRYATYWAPRLATTTSLVAAIGLASFGVWSEFESFSTVVILAAGGIVLLLLGSWFRHNLQHPAASWGVCIATTLIAAVIVLHREIPQYALAQTLLGPASPLRGQFASASDVPVVTIGHEWSEVPFYLGRNDIANSDNLESVDLVRQAKNAGKVVVIARTSGGHSDNWPLVPTDFRVVSTADRGRAKLMLLELMPPRELTARPVEHDAALR